MFGDHGGEAVVEGVSSLDVFKQGNGRLRKEIH